MSVYSEKREVWEHIILLLSDGICRYVYVAAVFLVRCWSVAAPLLAERLFYLRKDSMYVFVSRFPAWRGTVSVYLTYLLQGAESLLRS